MANGDDENPRARKKPKVRTGRRGPTGGNLNTEKLRQTFRGARRTARGAANVAGQATRAVTQETAGLAREFGRGVAGKGATPAGGGAPGSTQTTAQRLAQKSGQALRSINPFRGGAPAAPTAVPSGVAGSADAARAAATAQFEAGQAGGRGARGLRVAGRLAKGAGRLAGRLGPAGAGIAIGAEALTTTQEEKEAASGLPQVRPLRGLQPGGQAPGAEAPVNLERFGDPLLAAARPVIGTLRGAFGQGADQEISPTGEPIAAPAAGVRAPQFGAEGERSFTNADIGGGAINRGTASVEENQAVAQRLSDRGQAERAAGLRAAGQPGQPGQADPAATALARQAAGGGLASAFGALALSGNQLRREAADRTRGAAAQTAAAKVRQKSDLDLRNKLTEIGATNAANKTKNFAKDSVGLTESFNEALESGDEQQIANVRSSIFSAAQQDPDGAAGAAAKNLLAEDIRQNTESGFFGAIFNVFGSGRGPGAAISSLGQGGFNNEFQTAVDKLVLNEATGDLEIANPDGSGGRQVVTNIEDLTPESRDFLSQAGVRTLGAGQEATRGDPNRQDPNRPSLRSGL